MSKVRIYGDVSGYVDIAVPDNAGTTTLNLDKIPQADINGNIAMDTNTLYVDAANNRVGVGTASPNTALDIVSPSGAEAINIRGRSADDIGQLKFYENDGTTSLARLDSRTTHFEVGSYNELRFSAGGVSNSHVVIDISGNFGIGTSNPGKKLDVSGEIRNVAGQTITPAATSLYAADSTLSSYATTNGVYLNGHQNGWLRLNGDGTNRASIDLYGSGYNNFNDEIHFKTGNVGNRLVISNDGNVGIGMSSPGQKLVVDGNIQLGTSSGAGILYLSSSSGFSPRLQEDSNALSIYTNNSEAMRIRSSRAVSISTNGYVKNDAAQHLTIGDGASASSASLSVVRGEGLSGGTGPTINLYHGPDSGTQVQHIIASYIGDLLISADHQNIHSGTTIEFNIDGTRRLLLNGSGNLIMNSGSGIDFSATGNSSGATTSEILDDYEEGSWTPFFYDAGNVSGGYSYQYGRYTKIGRQVFIQFSMKNTTMSGSSLLRLGNLPFAMSSDTNGGGYVSVLVTGFASVGLEVYTGGSNQVFRDQLNEVYLTHSTAQSKTVQGGFTYFTT